MKRSLPLLVLLVLVGGAPMAATAGDDPTVITLTPETSGMMTFKAKTGAMVSANGKGGVATITADSRYELTSR